MRLPGILHETDLARADLRPREVARLRRAGVIRSVGSWLVTDEADPRILPFLRADLRPTCVDAAVLHGLWTPASDRAHAFRPRSGRASTTTAGMSVPPIRRTSASRAPAPLRSPAPILHNPVMRAWPDLDPVPELALVLQHAGRCLRTVEAAILLESALNRGLIGRHEVRDVLAGLPRRRRVELSRVDGRSESGTETRVRWWLESHRVPVRVQVVVHGVGRVDLLVGESWIIECDSWEFHGEGERYHRDRARDLRLRALGYTVTRLTWEQVFLDWESTSAFLGSVLRRRDHHRRLRRA